MVLLNIREFMRFYSRWTGLDISGGGPSKSREPTARPSLLGSGVQGVGKCTYALQSDVKLFLISSISVGSILSDDFPALLLISRMHFLITLKSRSKHFVVLPTA
jgi:hypothetical protein